MTVSPTSFTPSYFPAASIPTLPSVGLTDDEQALVQYLAQKAQRCRGEMLLADAYYKGEQAIRSLGIALPPQLADLRVIVGWPAVAVDPIVDRLSVEGFRVLGQTDSDMDLWELWLENGMPAEQSLAFTDALAIGRSYLTIGSDPDGGAPRICAESPLNMVVNWDVSGRRIASALQTYWMDDRQFAALYTPDETIQLAQDDRKWVIYDRDDHGFGEVPIVRLSNRPRSNNRDGVSEITSALRTTTDAACRALVNLVIAGELYSVPQRYILGATEADFVDSAGNPVPRWKTYLTNLLALERDDEGQLPQVGTFEAFDPSVYTTVVDMFAARVAGDIGATPQDLGLYTQGNPPSADAQQFAESRRTAKARARQANYGQDLIRGMKLALRFQNGGTLPSRFDHLEVDWMDPATPNIGADTAAIGIQVQEGMVPARSDVVLKRLRYTAVERARMEDDWKAQEGRDAQKAMNDLADGLLKPPAPAQSPQEPASGVPAGE